MIAGGGGVYTNVVAGAKLTLEGGTIDGSVEHTINGTFVMTGGTIQGTCYNEGLETTSFQPVQNYSILTTLLILLYGMFHNIVGLYRLE